MKSVIFLVVIGVVLGGTDPVTALRINIQELKSLLLTLWSSGSCIEGKVVPIYVEKAKPLFVVCKDNAWYEENENYESNDQFSRFVMWRDRNDLQYIQYGKYYRLKGQYLIIDDDDEDRIASISLTFTPENNKPEILSTKVGTLLEEMHDQLDGKHCPTVKNHILDLGKFKFLGHEFDAYCRYPDYRYIKTYVATNELGNDASSAEIRLNVPYCVYRLFVYYDKLGKDDCKRNPYEFMYLLTNPDAKDRQASPGSPLSVKIRISAESLRRKIGDLRSDDCPGFATDQLIRRLWLGDYPIEVYCTMNKRLYIGATVALSKTDANPFFTKLMLNVKTCEDGLFFKNQEGEEFCKKGAQNIYFVPRTGSQ